LTIGRVQGPSLAFVVDREIERRVHVPVPRWDVTCNLKKDNIRFLAKYRNSPIETESKAISVYESALQSKIAKVISVDKTILRLPPRYPFSLGELQRECYRFYHFPPITTLAIAEKLYLQALISYPRTDSQKLPQRIGPNKILRKLLTLPSDGTLVGELLLDPKKRSLPWQGPREDPAHPAIFPTGEIPRSALSGAEQKVFNIIVRRFCNTFAPDAVLEKTVADLDIGSNEFRAEGTRVLDQGWTKYYPHFSPLSDHLGVSLTAGEEAEVGGPAIDLKYNSLPSRYSEGSLLVKMEDEKIGTKATRADTISTLLKRLYVRKIKNELVPTANGFSLVETLKSHFPDILSTEITRNLEMKLELLQSAESRDEEIVTQIMSNLRSSLKKLRKIENVGWRQWEPSSERTNVRKTLGSCPICKTGKLQIIRSRRTGKRFIGCSDFTKGCKASSPAPPKGQIRSSGSVCTSCGWPNIFFSFSRTAIRRESCANFFCISRKKKDVER
jgi:DNA topoisomerase-1